tara:strand:+ start:982 stop:1719 length:738 start_codon:yes stop_codon:yes gene_type:complete
MPNTEIIPAEEALAADWQDARTMLEGIKLHGRLFLLGQALLGWKLSHVKQTLGFTHGGSRENSSGHGDHLNRTWENWVNSELNGTSLSTANRLMRTFEAARLRIKKLGGNSHALSLLSQNPADLDAEAINTVREIVKNITDGETQKDLLIELKLAKAPQGSGLTGGSKEGERRAEPTIQQLSLLLFSETHNSLFNLRTHGDYEKCLLALPLISEDEDQPSLTSIELQTEALLSDIRAAKAQTATA